MTTHVRNCLGAAILMATKRIQLITSKPADEIGRRNLRLTTASAYVRVSNKLAGIRPTRLLATGMAGAILCGVLCGPLAAADKSNGNQSTGNDNQSAGNGSNQGTTTWAGLNWGIGIATNFTFGGARNATATVVTNPMTNTNIVRVTDGTSNVDVGFVLEAHYFLRDFLVPFGGIGSCRDAKIAAAIKGPAINCTEVANGPFVAIEVANGIEAPTQTTKGPITGYALGWMVGLKHPDPDNPNSRQSWNFGLGFRVNPRAQVLGDGIVANQPLPPGDSTTSVRTKLVSRYGIMLLSSFSF